MIDRDAAIRQHRGKVTAADRKGRLPPPRPRDDFGRDVPPFEEACPFHRHHVGPVSQPGSTQPAPAAPVCNRTQSQSNFSIGMTLLHGSAGWVA